MRNLVLLIIGIALGALTASTLINAVNRRAAYPRGVMQVMQHHFGTLRDAVRAGQCKGPSTALHADRLRSLADEVEPSVFADATADPPFREYLLRLRAALDEMPSTDGDCKALTPIIAKIGNACDECHRQYR